MRKWQKPDQDIIKLNYGSSMNENKENSKNTEEAEPIH